MPKKFSVQFEYDDLGQTLDALDSRAQAWEDTAVFLRTGETSSESFIAEDCSDENEADRIAKHFRSIIKQIEKQVKAQGGWQKLQAA